MRAETRTVAKNLLSALAAVIMVVAMAPKLHAEWPANVEAELRKLGRVVEPGCTAKLVRGFYPKNDYNTYWPVDAAEPNKKLQLYPGVTIDRDVNFGPMPRDLADVFTGSKGGNSKTVLIYVPGGGGNKIEQQAVEANEFYDNIGRWATEQGMVGVTLQRSATNIPVLIDWLKANVAAKYKGNPDQMFIMAHSAGTGPLGQYIGRPDLYGVGVKGAMFMSGGPVNFGPPNANAGRGAGGGAAAAPAGGAAPAAGGGAPAAAQAAGGRGNNPTGQIGTSECTNTGGAGGGAGVIRGPSSASAMDQGASAAMRRQQLAGQSPWKWDGTKWINTGAPPPDPANLPQRGGGAGGGGGQGAPAGGRGAGAAAPAAGTAGNGEVPPPFTTVDGFKTTRVALMFGWAELDGGVSTDMKPPANVQLAHDELCKLEGPKAKDGVGHCPTVHVFHGESHMSEVFSIGSQNKTVSTAVLNFINSHK